MTPESRYPTQPQVGVGAVVIKDGSILLVKRGRSPGINLWAIPGGRINLGETLKKAVEREVEEETGVLIRAGDPIYTFDFIERDKKTA
ncbi:MAG: NUDIX domain-containing protein [Syntrophales bacterium]|jgi:ADP-ribose pyrophosphatase|nr:NUDIX domain-containing protein [Syntrophales bacterium]MDY0045073.1 NUDIX domain-containing protein [Syntrophales bacterium]